MLCTLVFLFLPHHNHIIFSMMMTGIFYIPCRVASVICVLLGTGDSTLLHFVSPGFLMSVQRFGDPKLKETAFTLPSLPTVTATTYLCGCVSYLQVSSDSASVTLKNSDLGNSSSFLHLFSIKLQ